MNAIAFLGQIHDERIRFHPTSRADRESRNLVSRFSIQHPHVSVVRYRNYVQRSIAIDIGDGESKRERSR